MQAPAPARLIEGGIPTEATVAHILVAKYADHLPLTDRPRFMPGKGLNLDRSTLAGWVGKAAFPLRPVHERLFERLKASTKLFADETTAPVLDPGRGRTKTGQLFAYARDDRPWDGSDPPGLAYLYAPDRKAGQTVWHLQGFVGTLQVDGYAGCKVLADRNAVSLAFCWSHVRPKFYDLAQGGPAPIAMEALARIAELYRIEGGDPRPPSRGAPRHPSGQKPLHRRCARAVVEGEARPRQPEQTRRGHRCALARWTGLSRFLDDGRVEIDSNVVERAIRPIALNRKNALFAGSTAAASTGPSSLRSSRPASSTASIHKLTSPTSSPALSLATRKARSTTCCRGPMHRSSSRPWPENTAYTQLCPASLWPEARSRPPRLAPR